MAGSLCRRCCRSPVAPGGQEEWQMGPAEAAEGLRLECHLDSGVAVVSVTGEIDISTSALLREHLLRVITDEPRRLLLGSCENARKHPAAALAVPGAGRSGRENDARGGRPAPRSADRARSLTSNSGPSKASHDRSGRPCTRPSAPAASGGKSPPPRKAPTCSSSPATATAPASGPAASDPAASSSTTPASSAGLA